MIVYNNHKTSVISELAQGSYVNIIQCCKCENKSYSFEPFTSIMIDIDINENNNSVVDLLIETFKEEIREADDWKCDKCNNKCGYIKLRRIWKLPELLFITLNRFKDCYKKNNRDVNINDYINFKSGSILSSSNEFKYKLNAIAIHQGNLSGGHYTALCNINEDKYNLYNDDNISSFNKEDINKIGTYAYMILYEIM
jgi:ubiquitin C-terminal hydrolase